MHLTAHAKINWTLSIVGQRADGYHLLDSVMQSVWLGDSIELYEADAVSLSLLGISAVPPTADNLVVRAAMRLKEATGLSRGVRIRLRKHTPVGAGMGGGSADAAAVLVGLNRLYDLRLSDNELAALGVSIGADVPFCLQGGLAHVGGIGEVIAPAPCAAPMELIVIQPCKGLSTPQVFAAYDALPIRPTNPDAEIALSALARGDARALAAALGNALQPAAIPFRPEIAVCIQTLEHFGALRAQMTGGGSAVIGLFASRRAANAAYRACSRIWPRCFQTRTAERGISLHST
ncbi:MAG: 4-(cytidine 5'-diphospho)-2-C-methyl-D-erythritol kinase [Oscillospiraceae bacterium]|jgi:4-diphosphocytidyl-2-C-methyl-D-erythritol kinase|nr:4-(cytidine 5'-diphospho)-2-C-methyl-D-erythritol kinase [Oscillospiraceae bacterium]